MHEFKCKVRDIKDRDINGSPRYDSAMEVFEFTTDQIPQSGENIWVAYQAVFPATNEKLGNWEVEKVQRVLSNEKPVEVNLFCSILK